MGMSTDRELLELAAKAVGVPVMGFNSDNEVERADGGRWKPLDDFCESVEIAHTLGFEVLFTDRSVLVLEIGESVVLAEESCSMYAHFAFMRAVVRAAAEIGRIMP